MTLFSPSADFNFPISLLVIEKTIATSKVHVEYFVPFDFSMAGIIKIYLGQV